VGSHGTGKESGLTEARNDTHQHASRRQGADEVRNPRDDKQTTLLFAVEVRLF
jgi:hypothetical protein